MDVLTKNKIWKNSLNTEKMLWGPINLYPNIWGCLTKLAIQFALSVHVIIKLSSFMIPPHLFFFIAPRKFSPVLRQCFFVKTCRVQVSKRSHRLTLNQNHFHHFCSNSYKVTTIHVIFFTFAQNWKNSIVFGWNCLKYYRSIRSLCDFFRYICSVLAQ